MISHIWQSTLFAAAAGLLTLLLKRNRARTRYWLWLAGLVKFLVPFGMLVSLGGHFSVPGWTPRAPIIVEPAISFVMGGDIGNPDPTTVLTAPQTTNNPLPAILFSVWACGFVGIAFWWVRRWIRVHADVRAASPLPMEIGIPVVSSPTMCEPGVFGIFRPVLLLPEGLEQHLSSPEWKCILAHELCHVRCYDNLTAAIYMLVEAIFWFHPLVWWLGDKLVTERELACDEEVLRLGSEPKVYAEGILKVCELYLESPLACVAGVTGSNLRQRIRAIMTQRSTERMSMGKKLVLAAAGVTALVAPVVFGVVNASSMRAQSPVPAASNQSQPPVPPAVVQVAQAARSDSGTAPASTEQSPSSKLQSLMNSVPPTEFEAAVVKPCKSADPLPECRTLHDLLSMSWAVNQDMISGEPPWAKSDFFEIVAKAPPGVGKPSDSLEAAERYAQMLRSLLVEQFKIAYHLEDKLIPVYALELGKQKMKLKQSEGPDDDYQSCKNLTLSPGVRSYECHHVPMQMLASWLTHQASDYIERPVVDATNLKGAYDISLHWATRRLADGIANGALVAGADPAETLTIFQAVSQQLGLTLSSRRYPIASVVIDHIEKLQ